MEFFIRRDDEFQRLYNCSFYNVSDIPLEKRVNMLIGGSVFVVSFIEEAIIFQFYFIFIFKHEKIE